MRLSDLINQEVRAALFDRCESKMDALVRAVAEAEAHLKRRDPERVLGVIDGLHNQLAVIHCLMSLARDFGPPKGA